MKNNLLLWLTAGIFSFNTQAIELLTENYPPYNHMENGKITGLSVEVVQAVLKEVNSNDKIRVFPWVRAYNKALKEKDVALFGVTRTPQREKLFHWVGAVNPSYNTCVYGLVDKKFDNVNKIEDLKQYRIGVVRGDIIEKYFFKKGFLNNIHIKSNTSHQANMEKLLVGRIDLAAMVDVSASYYIKQKNLIFKETLQKLYCLDELSSEGSYMIFSKKTSIDIVRKFRAGLKRIKQNGKFDEIIKKYIN